MWYLLLIAIILGLIWSVYNLLRKVEKYEDIIEENDKFIEDELARNEALLEALRQIDNRQMFEKDDDVGSLFNLIKPSPTRGEGFSELIMVSNGKVPSPTISSSCWAIS